MEPGRLEIRIGLQCRPVGSIGGVSLVAQLAEHPPEVVRLGRPGIGGERLRQLIEPASARFGILRSREFRFH